MNADPFVSFAEDVFGKNFKESLLFREVHPGDREDLAVEFARFVADELDNYADTFRITRTSDGVQNRSVHESKRSCCGCFDTLVVCSSGRKYFIGFNYGH